MDSLPKLRSQSPLSTQTILPDCTEIPPKENKEDQQKSYQIENQTVTKVVDNRQVKE